MRRAIVASIAVLAFPAPALAAEPTPTPFDGFGDDVVDAFGGTNLVFYGSAVVVSLGMSLGGVDHAAQVATQRHLHAPAWGTAAYYGGYVGPVVVAPGIYAIGLAFGDRTTAGAGAAATQALAIAAATTGVLKWATGRPYPTHGGDPNDPTRLDHPEWSRELHPFDFHGLWAWPSGHTSASISVAAALSAYYPENPYVPIVGYSVGLAIGVGMVVGDRHWASDVVAGALFGHAIGWSVGSSFRRRIREGSSDSSGVELTLAPMPGASGLAVVGAF